MTRDIVDLGGLTSDRIAHAPGGHLDKRVSQAFLEAQAPRWVVLHSTELPRVSPEGALRGVHGYPVEMRVARMKFIRADYRVVRVLRFAPRYYYVILAPDF